MTTTFQERVYATLRKVPKGKVTTYADLGLAVGCPSPRAIGQVMRNNPYAPATPCHRVVASTGAIGGFNGQATGSAISRKIARLHAEGIFVRNGRIVDFERVRYRFS